MLDLVFRDESVAPPDVSGPGIAAWRDDVGEVFARAGRSQHGYWLTWRDLGTFAFTPRSDQVAAWATPGQGHEWVADQFTRIVQPVILQALGHEALHASAVLTPDGVVAFCGVSGSGKSTLAFAWGRNPGCRQVADDALVLDVDAEDVRTVLLPFRSRLRASAEAFFAREAAPVTASGTSRHASLRSVFVLAQRTDHGSEPLLTPIGRPAAFTALLTHAHCFDEADRAGVSRMVQAYLTVADRVPVFALSYRADFSGIPTLIDLARRASDAAWPGP